MVTGGSHQGIGQPPAGDDFTGCRQGAIHSPPCGGIGVAVDGGEGVDTVITRKHRGLLGWAHFIADGKYIRVQRLSFGHLLTGAPDIVDKVCVMDGINVLVRKGARFDRVKKAAFSQVRENAADAHRRFDISVFVNMMDAVAIVDHQGNLFCRTPFDGGIDRFGLYIVQRSQLNRIVTK